MKSGVVLLENFSSEHLHPGERNLFPQRNRRLLILFTVTAALASVFTTVTAAIAVMLFCIVCCARKDTWENLAAHPTLSTAGLICLTILYSLSALRSPFGADAMVEGSKYLCALSLAGFALLQFRKEHLPALLWSHTAVVSTAAFLSLDMAGGQLLFAPVSRLGNAMGMAFGSFPAMSNLRLNGIFNNCNVLAGMTGLSFMIGLYLLRTAAHPRTRTAAAILLGLNGVAFWLCVSRGAMLCLAVSLLLWLLLTERSAKAELLLQMILCVAATAGFAVLTLLWLAPEGGSPLAYLPILLCGPTMLAGERWLLTPLHRVLTRKPRFLPLCGCACAALALCAVTLKGSYTFDSEHFIFRTADLRAGETYEVTGAWEGDIRLRVITEGEEDLLLDRQTLIYEGPLEQAVFTLPADTASVLLRFDGSPGDVLRRVEFPQGEKVCVNRLLLPEALESRLADRLMTSVGFLLRLEYVKDGLQIWRTAPLLGRGLGSTEHLYPTVQKVRYESLYAHNHAIQLLADMGLAGLGAFLLVILGLFQALQTGKHPEKALFFACLTMLTLHSLMEINFSVRAYALQGYLLLSIMSIACGGHEPPGAGRKTVAAGLAIGYLLTLAMMTGQLLSRRILSAAVFGF